MRPTRFRIRHPKRSVRQSWSVRCRRRLTSNIIAANDRFARLLGTSAADVVGRDLAEYASRLAQPVDCAMLVEALAGAELGGRRPGSAHGPVALNIQPIGGAKATHIIVTEDAGPTDGQISHVIDNLLASVFIVDVTQDGQFRYAMLNRRHEELTGLHLDEVIGRAPSRCCRRTMPPACLPITGPASSAGSRPPSRRCCTFRPGAAIGNAAVPIIGGPSGSRVTRLFGSSIDISERVEAEQALRDSEQRFRSIFEHAGVGIGYAAVDGKIIDVNRTLETMLGYGREEVIGHSFKQFVHEDEISQVTGRFLELLSGRRATFQTERRFQRRDGTELWARTTASLVRDPLGRPKYIIGLFEDVTEARRARERIHYLASFDQVTGLPNLSLFGERVATALERPAADDRIAALLAISFDRLDPIRFAHSRSPPIT